MVIVTFSLNVTVNLFTQIRLKKEKWFSWQKKSKVSLSKSRRILSQNESRHLVKVYLFVYPSLIRTACSHLKVYPIVYKPLIFDTLLKPRHCRGFPCVRYHASYPDSFRISKVYLFVRCIRCRVLACGLAVGVLWLRSIKRPRPVHPCVCGRRGRS